MDEAQDQYSSILKSSTEPGSETVYYSALHEGLPEEFRLMAEQQLNETDEKRREGMKKLKEIMKHENMPSFNDIYLLAILRCCKYNLKNGEAKLKKFAATYQLIAGMASGLELVKVEYIIDDMYGGINPYRDKNGVILYYTRPYGMDQGRYTIEEVANVGMMVSLFMLTFPITTVAGIVYFADCRSGSLSAFYSVFKQFRRLIMPMLSLPYRVKKVEVIGTFDLIRWFYMTFSLILPYKIRKRVVFHSSDLSNLHIDYDPNILPDAFGGNVGPLSNKHYKNKLLEFIKDLKAEYQKFGS